VVLFVRIALWLLPFRLLHRLVARLTRRPAGRAPSTAVPAERITWAVAAVARRIPRATCLTQALAATLLLAWRGHAATLRLGVAKKEDGSLHAHAWLECGGIIILGEPEEGAFMPLPPLSFP
jgi:Transglutaminase-like superfamily